MSENREEIIAKINKYIDWLATPNEVFGGFPICPFIEKERTSGKLKYEIFRPGLTNSIFNLHFFNIIFGRF